MVERGDRSPGRRGTLGGILGLLALAATVPLAAVLLHVDTPVIERERRLPPTPIDDVALLTDGIVYDMDFADRRHGFALWGRCLRYWQRDCATTLLITQDGVSWAARGVHADLQVSLEAQVLALGPCRVAIGARTAVRLFSADCGRSWRSVPLAPNGTVNELPQGAALESPCYQQPEYVAGCAERRLLVTLPATGRRAWLAGPAPLERPRAERVPTADGGWWVSGRDPATGRLALAVSRDDGRSWSVGRLPKPKGEPFQDRSVIPRLSVTASGHDVYATAVGRFHHDRALLAIFRSADGGASWRQTRQATGGEHPRGIGGVAVAAPDGQLIVVSDDGGSRYRSTDGGATFHRSTIGEPIAWPSWTRAGYLARSGEHPERWYLSQTGAHWVRLALPSG